MPQVGVKTTRVLTPPLPVAPWLGPVEGQPAPVQAVATDGGAELEAEGSPRFATRGSSRCASQVSGAAVLPKGSSMASRYFSKKGNVHASCDDSSGQVILVVTVEYTLGDLLA